MSKIEWTQETWNPVVGCTKCSPGCQNCYAERMAKRLKAMGLAKYQDVVDERGWTGRIAFDEDELRKPFKRKKPTLYFVDSMGDLFHENGVQYLDDIHDALYSEEARCHFFLLLTKRIDKFKQLNDDFGIIDESVDHIGIGVTVCNQAEADEKIPLLLQIPAALRFVSIEPMLGPVDLTRVHFPTGVCENVLDTRVSERAKRIIGRLNGIDWVICGGETGPGARPMQPDWVRGVRDQCVGAGVPFFFKQWGEHDYRTIRMGKKKSGHLIDGQEWRQVPEVLKKFFGGFQMTYHEIMRKLCESGYKHEWNFGDRGFDSLVGVDFIVTDVAKKHTVLSVHYEDGGIGSIDYRTRCVPLPTVEQWKDLFIKSGHELKVICLLDGLIRLTVEDMTKMNTKPIKEGCFDLHIGLAILYARIALNLKWNEEKGEFER